MCIRDSNCIRERVCRVRILLLLSAPFLTTLVKTLLTPQSNYATRAVQKMREVDRRSIHYVEKVLVQHSDGTGCDLHTLLYSSLRLAQATSAMSSYAALNND